MRYYLTLDEDKNKFRFVCPIFNVETQMSLCLKLRDLVWRGRKPEVRRGCQACMSASKCPAAAIVSRISYGRGQVPDDYGSKDPGLGKIRKDILSRVHRTVVLERTLNEYQVPDKERELIATSSERIGKMIGAAPLPSEGGPTYSSQNEGVRTKKRRSAPRASNNNDRVKTAAETGDLSAAIS